MAASLTALGAPGLALAEHDPLPPAHHPALGDDVLVRAPAAGTARAGRRCENSEPAASGPPIAGTRAESSSARQRSAVHHPAGLQQLRPERQPHPAVVQAHLLHREPEVLGEPHLVGLRPKRCQRSAASSSSGANCSALDPRSRRDVGVQQPGDVGRQLLDHHVAGREHLQTGPGDGLGQRTGVRHVDPAVVLGRR